MPTLSVRRPTFTRAPTDTSDGGQLMTDFNRSPSPAPSYVLDDSYAPPPGPPPERRPSVAVLARPRTFVAEHWRELSVSAALIALSSWMLALQVQFNAFLPWCDEVAERDL